MKWILLIWLVFYCDPNDSTSSENNFEKLLSPKTNARNARTLGFSSEEEEDKNGIHLHIWNDMSNKNNFYPNLLKHIAEESVKSDDNDVDTATMVNNESNPNSSPTHLHFNLNELMPTPQPQVSAVSLLKNALVHTLELDKFRKSDHNLYGSFYKLKTEHKPNSWNYHPSSVNYIPKPYNTNLSGPMPMSTSTKLPKTLSATKTSTTLRPTLSEQIRTTRNFIQDYYTNLPKTKPKSVIQSIGYEIGGISKYSGRLLANEPMPQRHRTFKMFEPVPRQIMLPPPTHRIPDFKPVPPRLKIIPVIDEILNSGNRLALNDESKSLPWNLVKIEQKAKPNHLAPVLPKQLQMLPFNLNEAITMAPFRHYVPKTEYNHIESSTEAYHRHHRHHSVLSPDIETLQKIRAAQNQIILPNVSTKSRPNRTTTKAPKSIDYLPNQYDTIQSNHSTSVYRRFPNDHYKTDAKLPILFNEHNGQYSSDYEYTINKNNSDIVDFKKPVSLENSRSNFTDRTQITTYQRQQQQRQINDIDTVRAPPKKSLYKKPKTMHKSPQPSTDGRLLNDITNLNITGIQHEINNNYDCLGGGGQNGSSQTDTINIECNSKNSNDMYALQLGAYNNDGIAPSDVLIDSVPSNSIQLSQTYSRQTTNVPQHKPPTSSSSLLLMPTAAVTTATTTESEQGEQTLQQLLANDIRKALLTSLGNDSNSNDHVATTTTHDPFLIAVYDEHDRAMHDATDISDDLQFAETATKTSNSMEIGRNTKNSIQRIDKNWAIDRRDTVAWPIDNHSEKTTHSKHKTKPKTKITAKTELNSTLNMNRTKIDKTNQTNNNSSSSSSSNSGNLRSNLIDEKYYKWFNEYAEENKKLGRTIISEHFKKVKIEPNISWVILPR